MARKHEDILYNKQQILDCMGIGNERFFRWLELGAPIACENGRGGRTEYTAHVRDLQEWRARIFTWRKLKKQEVSRAEIG